MRADGDELLRRAEQRRDEGIARPLEAADAGERAPAAAVAEAPAPVEVAPEVPAEPDLIVGAPPGDPPGDVGADAREVEMHVEDAGDEEFMGALAAGSGSWRPSRRAQKEATRLLELLLTTGVSEGDARAKIVELYSPPRMAAALGRLPPMSLAGGPTYDLRQDADGRARDFRRADHRQRARADIARARPYLVIGIPPFAEFSAIQSMSRSKRSAEKERRRMAEAPTLLGFAVEVYIKTAAGGEAFPP